MAEKMLGETGGFLPYAAALYKDGEIRHLTVDPASTGYDIQEIVTALENSLVELAKEEDTDLVSTVLCMDIKMTPSEGPEAQEIEEIEPVHPGTVADNFVFRSDRDSEPPEQSQSVLRNMEVEKKHPMNETLAEDDHQGLSQSNGEGDISPSHDKKVDCIMMRLENAEGEALEAFRPYAIDLTGEVRYSRMFATQTLPKNSNNSD